MPGAREVPERGEGAFVVVEGAEDEGGVVALPVEGAADVMLVREVVVDFDVEDLLVELEGVVVHGGEVAVLETVDGGRVVGVVGGGYLLRDGAEAAWRDDVAGEGLGAFDAVDGLAGLGVEDLAVLVGVAGAGVDPGSAGGGVGDRAGLGAFC